MNPYKVLGISEYATPEEIRAAYLSLVKKYHPDKYTDNPLKELAGEKLKEINQAYEMLTKKQGGTTSAGRPYGGNSSHAGRTYDSRGSNASQKGYNGPNRTAFVRARSFINQNNLGAAAAVLDAISEKNAEWYFLYGIIYLRQGWYEKARSCIARAYELAPDNTEYRNAYLSLQNAANPYGRTRSASGGSGSLCDFCSTMLLCNCCTRGMCCYC